MTTADVEKEVLRILSGVVHPVTGKNIVGSLMYKPELLPRLLNFLVRKQDSLPFEKIVSHTFPLAEVNDAFVQAEWDQSQTPITRAMLVP